LLLSAHPSQAAANFRGDKAMSARLVAALVAFSLPLAFGQAAVEPTHVAAAAAVASTSAGGASQAADAKEVSKCIVKGFNKGTLDLTEEKCIEDDTSGIVVGIQGELTNVLMMTKAPGETRSIGQQMVSGAVVLLEKVELLVQQCLKPDAQKEIHEAIANMKNPNAIEGNIIENKVTLERDVIGAITEWLSDQKCLAAEQLGDGLRATLV